MNIFAYIGSYRGQESFTQNIVMKLLEGFKSVFDEQIHISVFSPTDISIKTCIGCNVCFNTGKCNLDDSDDMRKIKFAILESDIIVFASPVYLHNVTGNMKNFFDRLAYWTHLLRLVGKLGIALTVTDSSGEKETGDYIVKIMNYLGVSVIGDFRLKKRLLSGQDSIDSMIRVWVDQLCNSISLRNFPITITQQLYFSNMRDNLQAAHYLSYEKQFWLDNGLFSFDTYSEVFRNKCNFIK